MTNFYLPNSEQNYLSGFWQEDEQTLKDYTARLLSLEKANQLDLGQFFTKKETDVKPHLNQNYQYIAMPYELDDKVYQGIDAITILCDVLNPLISDREIFIASTDRDKCCVIQCDYLSEEIIYSVYNLNTPFIIFTEKAEIFALVDYDLPLQIIGYSQNFAVKIDNYNLIQQGFDTVFQRYAGYTNMRNLFKTYYAFLLPKTLLL